MIEHKQLGHLPGLSHHRRVSNVSSFFHPWTWNPCVFAKVVDNNFLVATAECLRLVVRLWLDSKFSAGSEKFWSVRHQTGCQLDRARSSRQCLSHLFCFGDEKPRFGTLWSICGGFLGRSCILKVPTFFGELKDQTEIPTHRHGT